MEAEDNMYQAGRRQQDKRLKFIGCKCLNCLHWRPFSWLFTAQSSRYKDHKEMYKTRPGLHIDWVKVRGKLEGVEKHEGGKCQRHHFWGELPPSLNWYQTEPKICDNFKLPVTASIIIIFYIIIKLISEILKIRLGGLLKAITANGGGQILNIQVLMKFSKTFPPVAIFIILEICSIEL